MIFGLIVIGVFVAASIYFFFRAETLQREVISVKREASHTNKENKALVASMVKVSSCIEDITKKRHAKLKSVAEAKKDNEVILSALQTILPLVQNYAAIYLECSKGSSQLQATTKKCYENFQKNSFKDFITFINKQDRSVKTFWSSNNLVGFISLVEALLVQLEGEAFSNNPEISKKAVNE